MSDAGTLGPCLSAEEARKRTEEKAVKNPPRYEPTEEDVAWARGAVEPYFRRNVESCLLWGQESRSLQIKVSGQSHDKRACALARELAAFLRTLGFHAAYGPHERHFEDEFDDDEFWPVFVNW